MSQLAEARRQGASHGWSTVSMERDTCLWCNELRSEHRIWGFDTHDFVSRHRRVGSVLQ